MSEKIKILHVIKSLGRGGAEMLLPETLSVHDRGQFEFHYIYFLPWKNQMVAEIEKNGGMVSCLSAKNNLQLILRVDKIVRYVREHKIDLIHAHLPWAGVVARMAGRLLRIPVIYTEHNKQERYHWLTRMMNLITMNWLSGLIAVSEDVEQSIRSNKRFLRVPISTILNGVNIEKFSPTHRFGGIRSQLGIPQSAPVIGTVAVFRFQKRLDLWLELAAEIKQKVPAAHFVIVGDGPLKTELEAKCSALQLNNCVHFPGLETEIRPYLRAFDVYMMSSIFEGLPIALLEAMAMECPIITTDAGGIKEVVRHGVDGMVCPVDDARKLIGFAKDLLSSKEVAVRLGKAARNRVRDAFSMTSMVRQLEDYYKKFAVGAPD